ncbi:MAG: hypothetical protein WC205_02360 [Opitutaceae bacterium]|jgi:hypothetical protein
MKFTYEAKLLDVVEPSFRLFKRTPAYAANRWRGAVICAVAFALFAFLGFHSKENINLLVICLGAGAWGGGLYLLTYRSTVRRRITKFVSAELKGSWPRTIRYELKNEKLTSKMNETVQTFALAKLTGVTEDKKFIELSFGTKSPCVIPLRAFESTDEKTAFRSAIGHL